MIFFHYIIVALSLHLTIFRTEYIGQDINTDKILLEYVLICGFDYLCNPESVPFLDSVPKPTGYSETINCSYCSCDAWECQFEDNCCPDVIFTYSNMSCVDLDLSSAESDVTSDSAALMVTTCPDGTPEKLRMSCSETIHSNADKISQVPVTSEMSVFRNRFCAKCHGVEPNLTSSWSFNIECDRVVDINHLSSYDEIVDVAEENMCPMRYKPPSSSSYPFLCSTVYNFTNFYTCNLTGYWSKYDPDIAWACTNTRAQYRMFTSIFCLICNPSKPLKKDGIISTCNQTGMWHPFDHKLEQACLHYPNSEISYPFKNKFCFLCNRKKSTSGPFMDAEVSVQSDVYSENENVLLFNIEYFHTKELNHSNISIGDLYPSENLFPHGVNMSKLLLLSYAHYGKGASCDDTEETTTDSDVSCSCTMDCIKVSSCCIEFAFQRPVSYVNEYINSASVSKCFRISDVDTKNKCENINSTRSVFQIPVRSKESDILYRNVYCFLCNEEHGYQIVQLYDPLDIEIKCNFVFQTEHYHFLDDVLQDISSMTSEASHFCSVRVVIDKTGDLKTVSEDIHTCNVTGQWDTYDSDIEWACLNYIPEITDSFEATENRTYRNIFCEMCNIASEIESTITSCNVTGNSANFDITLYNYCNTVPYVTSMKPYKNYFCKLCNRPALLFWPNLLYNNDFSWTALSLDCDGKKHQSDVIGPAMRDMFTINATPDIVDSALDVFNKYGNHCMDNAVYDVEMNSCKVQQCSSGKNLKGGKCVPLLQKTAFLGYTMALKVTGTTTSFQNTTMDSVLSDIESGFLDYLANALDLTSSSFIMVGLHISVSDKCTQTVTSSNPVHVTILLRVSFYVTVVVNRVDIEYRLVNMTNSSIRHNISNFHMDMNIEPDVTAFNLAGNIVLLDREANCFQMKLKWLEYDRNYYRLKLVSKLLLCPNVELEKDRYTFDSNSHEITLKPNGPVLLFGSYYLFPNGSVLVCIEDFMKMVDSRDPEEKTDALSWILGVVSFLCVCLSMLCLSITFLTYCFFAELRTLPGKVNMCLILGLFFSQGLMQFGLKQNEHQLACMVIGILLHFFWLSTFFSMNTCSFHMCRVFIFPVKYVAHRWTSFCYICYIFGMPSLIITIYISLSFTVFGFTDLGYTSSGKCFLSTYTAMIIAFILPVSIVCFSNIIFFAVTAYKISTAPKVPSNKTVRQEFPVYVKLFVVTGATWILQIIDSFLPLSVFSIIVGVINGCQGIFIFLSYSVNGRVRKLYKTRLTTTTSTALRLSRNSKQDSESPTHEIKGEN